MTPLGRLVAAAVISRSGDVMAFVALPLYALSATGSPVAVSALVLAEGGALIAGGWLAQLVVDRLPPRRLLVVADIARSLAVATLAIAPSYPLALAVASVLALGTAVASPVTSALVPRIAGDSPLTSANGLLWSAGVVPQLVMAPLAGVMVERSSASIAFALDAVSFLGSAAILTSLPRLGALATPIAVWRQVPEALAAVREVPGMVPLLIVQGLSAVGAGASSALLVVLADSAYRVGAGGYGLWLGLIGAGALTGPLAGRLLRRVAPGRVVATAFLVRGLGDVLLALLGNPVAAALLLGSYGAGTSSGTIAFQTLVQRSAPPPLRGRAFALLDVTWQTGRLLSIAAGAALVVTVGVRAIYLAGGALLLAAGIVGSATLCSREVG